MWSLKDKYVYWLISSRNGQNLYSYRNFFGNFLFYCPNFCNLVIFQTATKKGILHAATLALYNELSVWFCIFSISPIWGLNTDLQSEVLGVNHSATTPSKWAVDILQNEERGLRGAYTPQNNLRGFILRCNGSCPYSPWPYSMLKTHGTSRMPFPFLRITTTLSVSIIPWYYTWGVFYDPRNR